MSYYAILDASRERYLAPRRRLADRLFVRWQRHRAGKRFDLSDRLLKRAEAIGISFHFANRKVFWGFGFRMFPRFARRFRREAGADV